MTYIHASERLTCALVLQALPEVALLADAVVLARVRATPAAGHQVAAVESSLTQGGAERQVLLDVASSGQVCGGERETG